MIEKNNRFSDKKRFDKKYNSKNKSSIFKSVSTNVKNVSTKNNNNLNGIKNTNSNSHKIEHLHNNKTNNNRNEDRIAQRNLKVKPIYKLNSLTSVSCPICGKIINNMSSSMCSNDRNEYYHFECVTSSLRKKLNIKPNQRLTYLGSSSFGVIEDTKDNSKMKFSIKQKIQFVRN